MAIVCPSAIRELVSIVSGTMEARKDGRDGRQPSHRERKHAMSHSCAIVMVEDGFCEGSDLSLKDKVEWLLAPYDDGLMVPPYIDMTRDEIVAGIGKGARMHYGNALCDRATHGDTEAIRKIARDWFGYQLVDDDGNAYTTCNPSGRWDYWNIEDNDSPDDWLAGIGAPTFRSDDIPDPELIDRWVGNVVTPDGVWHRQEIGDGDGSFVPSKIIGRYPNCTCVSVDIHI